MPTKKTFAATAAILAQHKGKIPPAALRSLALAFADEYKTQNPRFDTFRFVTACGVELGHGEPIVGIPAK